ncbi:MAG: hypothetical protein WA988_12080 [Candidatus Nanopelagicales bacterium]
MEWERVRRVGVPEIELSEHQPNTVELRIGTEPTGPATWRNYFLGKMAESGVRAQFTYKHGDDGEGIHLSASEDTFEDAIRIFDEALEYANDRYEAEVLPAATDKQRQVAAEKQAAADRQQNLEDRAAKLAKPGKPVWQQYRDGERR